ncbi:MAG: pyridoxamine 5'-phosphate oxidase family protein [Nitrosopumilaceae archaeon]
MVQIPLEVKELIESQGIFAVGSVGNSKFANISPRIFFDVREETIYWLDFFQHKSYRNFKANPRVTVAAYDKKDLTGFQLRGMVSFVTDEPERTRIKDEIIKRTLRANPSEKVKKISEKEAQVILFEPKVVYSLNPEYFADLCIGSDVDATDLFEKC